MMDFAYQVKSCAVHSIGAIEGLKQGRFSPDMTTPPDSFAALKAKTADTLDKLNALSAEDVEALSEKPLIFTIGDKLRWEFRGQRSEEHTSELQSLMRISYAVFCLQKNTYAEPAHAGLQPQH